MYIHNALFSVVVMSFVIDLGLKAEENEPTAKAFVVNANLRPYFQRENYSASALNFADGVFLLVNNGPIILRNCRSFGMLSLRIQFQNSVYHPVQPSRFFLRQTREEKAGEEEYCWLSKIRLKSFFLSENNFPARINLEAMIKTDEEEEVVGARTTLDIAREYDGQLDNPIFEANGIEYIVLNYKFFKAFLVVVLAIAGLISTIALKDIARRYGRIGAVREVYYQI